jgi:hypothetical protein
MWVLSRGSGVTAAGDGSSSEADSCRDTNLAGTLTKAAHASRVVRIPLPIEGYSPARDNYVTGHFLSASGPVPIRLSASIFHTWRYGSLSNPPGNTEISRPEWFAAWRQPSIRPSVGAHVRLHRDVR